MRIYKLLFVLSMLALKPDGLNAQALEHEPQTLSQVPKGASADNPFWQHLVLSLSRNPSAGNTVIIALPVGVTVADLDGDGDVIDEISVDNEAGSSTGYRSVAGSIATQILLTSTTGGLAGRVHIQFPIATPLSPATASVAYGKVEFSNPGERDLPAGSLALAFVDAVQLKLADFTRLFEIGSPDTTTNRQGDQYPDSASAAFVRLLPDLVGDQSGTLGSEALSSADSPFADGDDDNDVTYRFWFSKTDSLNEISVLDSTIFPALDAADNAPVLVHERDAVELAFDLRDLAEGVYYLYMTSNLTGRFPLARSRGIKVLHKPTVLEVGGFLGDDDDYLDSGLLLNFDTGLPGPSGEARDQLDIAFNIVDFDDSAEVKIFFAAADSLADTALLTTTGSSVDTSLTITGLTGATAIDTTTVLVEGVHTSINWRALENDSTFVAEGRYFIYAAATDGKDLTIGRSVHAYQIRHSPFFAFDVRRSRLLETGGDQPQQYYTITWIRDLGIDGDQDPDQSAKISLFYSARDDFLVPDGGSQIQTEAVDPQADTHLLVFGISEDADSRSDNQFTWDLWNFVNADDGGVPVARQPYFLYALVSADSTQRLVRWEDESGQPRSLSFIHSPMLRVEAPLKVLEVDGRQSFDVRWQAQDVDDIAGIWVVLTSQAAGQVLGEETTYADLIGDAVTDWIGNSADGSLESGTALEEGRESQLTVRPSRMLRDLGGADEPIGNGEYYVYVIIDAAKGAAPALDNRALRASGVVTITGFEQNGAAGLATPALEVLPANRDLSAGGDTARFEIRPNAGGRDVDLVAFFASVDTHLVQVVDQNEVQDGVQPFLLNPALAGLSLVDTLKAGVDSTTAGKWLLDLIYFEQAGNASFNGDLTLATVELVSKDTSGATDIDIDNFQERQSALYRNGAVVATFSPQLGARLTVRPRASLAGRVLLQGRALHNALVTFELRDRNQFVPISDSLFCAANDLDTTVVGIQDSLQADGSFDLVKVPNGDYHLVAHVDGFLDGQFPSLRVDSGEALTGIDPMILTDGVTRAQFLLGGDVTGFADSSGTSRPDNEIDQLDVDFVVSYFGEPITAAHPGLLADIDGDRLIWVADLNLVAANFGREGVEPVFKPALAGDRPHINLERKQINGDVVLDVAGTSWQGLRAYGLRLRYNATKGRLVRHQAGELWDGQPAVYAIKDNEGEVVLGGALMGLGQGGDAQGCLARLYFAPYPGVPAAELVFSVTAAQGVDNAHQSIDLVLEAPLPTAFRLLQNYPNPFNPQTSLQIQMPYRSHVDLAIYDITGQRLRVLSAGQLAAGVHTFVWDGRDRQGRAVASGTYLARFNSEAGVSVRKMQLIR